MQFQSVIVTTYNRPRALARVLDGLERQSETNFEVIIADDGSGAETYNFLQNYRPKNFGIRHVWIEDKGYRRTVILNKAINISKGSRCIFLDGDCIPTPCFVRDHRRFAESGYVLAGGRLLLSERLTADVESGHVDILGASLFELLRYRLSGDLNRLAPLVTLPDGRWRKSRSSDWKILRGCNLSMDKELLIRVNGFDETLHGWGMEDSDIAVRCLNTGAKLKSIRFAASVFHLWHKEASRDRELTNRDYLDSAISSKRIQAMIGLTDSQEPATVIK